MTHAEPSDRPFPNAPLECAPQEVREEWLDYNNHMNVGYYGLAFDRALDEIYETWLGLHAGVVRELGMGPFALQQHFHYLRELRLGDRFVVRLQLLDTDEKRAHFLLSMSNAATEELSATCEQISMNVDHAARRSTPYPDGLRRRLQELMAAHRDLPRPSMVGAPLGLRRDMAD